MKLIQYPYLRSHQLFSHVAILIAIGLTITCSAGCNRLRIVDNYALPVGVANAIPYTYKGRTHRIYGGDSFEIIENQKTHFVTVEGISTPSSQPHLADSRMHLRKLGGDKALEITVIGQDEMHREVAHAVAIDEEGNRINVALSLLENGLAWFDHSEGDYADEYQRAEAKAKNEKLGIWSKEEMLPPWHSWEEKLDLFHFLSDKYFIEQESKESQ